MIKVGVSGAGGQMGRTVASAIAANDSTELTALYDPGCEGDVVEGLICSREHQTLAGCDVVVDFTRPDVVMENLIQWHRLGVSVVVGTSGFDESRIAEVKELWAGQSKCLIVPNFSIGAILMMRFAAEAASRFRAVEVVELHHDRKADAPSGTSIATANMIGPKSEQARAVASQELVEGALGAEVNGVRIHSVRMPGLLAHQEVILGNPGEILTIRHDSTSRESFMPGVLLAINSVAKLPSGLSVGLEQLL